MQSFYSYHIWIMYHVPSKKDYIHRYIKAYVDFILSNYLLWEKSKRFFYLYNNTIRKENKSKFAEVLSIRIQYYIKDFIIRNSFSINICVVIRLLFISEFLLHSYGNVDSWQTIYW